MSAWVSTWVCASSAARRGDWSGDWCDTTRPRGTRASPPDRTTRPMSLDSLRNLCKTRFRGVLRWAAAISRGTLFPALEPRLDICGRKVRACLCALACARGAHMAHRVARGRGTTCHLHAPRSLALDD